MCETYLTLPIFYVHFKDIKIKADKLDQVGSSMAPTLEYSSPKLPGMGEINWGKFVSALMDIRYEGPVVMETEDMAFENSLA
jgi:sugar phosphate isomerase/epimerase